MWKVLANCKAEELRFCLHPVSTTFFKDQRVHSSRCRNWAPCSRFLPAAPPPLSWGATLADRSHQPITGSSRLPAAGLSHSLALVFLDLLSDVNTLPFFPSLPRGSPGYHHPSIFSLVLSHSPCLFPFVSFLDLCHLPQVHCPVLPQLTLRLWQLRTLGVSCFHFLSSLPSGLL